jgi:benzoylformate decarboxylase
MSSASSVRTGKHLFLDLLRQAGVEKLFGNPGTTELALIDAVAERDDVRFVLGLHETPVLAMAEGYAMAGRRLAVVNLHASCGLGNAMGMLYNAHRSGSPLLVTAGQQDRRLAFEEPILWSDLAAVARPWCKWSAEVTRFGDLASAVRRAVQTALTPPTGPVFLSLPMDVLEESGPADVELGPRLDVQVRPPVEALDRAARLLASARNPLILAGSRVQEAGAVDELVRLAETLGAPVASESGTTHGRLAFPPRHPLSAPALPLWAPEVRDRLAAHDLIFVTGMDLLRLYVYFEPSRAIPEHCQIIHLDEDPWQIGKNYPVAVGLLGGTKPGLAELTQRLAAVQSESQREQARRRADEIAVRHAAARAELVARAASERETRPSTPLAVIEAVGRVLPADAAVIEEAVTTTNTYLERLGCLQNTDGYFGHRGWALGWGLGCALGVQLAWPDRPVVALLGDGASLYGIQGLWTAARERLPVAFVLMNNRQYQILKVGARQLGLPAATRGRFLGMDLDDPPVDFLRLAESLGVEAVRAESPDAVADELAATLRARRPRLIEVPIDRAAPDKLKY